MGRTLPWLSNSIPSSSRSQKRLDAFNTTVEHEAVYREATALNIGPQDEHDDESACVLVDKLRKISWKPDLKQPPKPPPPKPRAPFRFLDLPPELRNEVYRWASVENKVLRLKNFLTPAISRVSRQLRHEALPVFFKVNTFIAEVRSTFMGFHKEPAGYNARYVDSRYLEYSRTGAVSLTKDVNPLLNSYWARLAIFKDIDFCLLHPFDAKDGRTVHRNAVLSVRDRKVTVHARQSSHYKRMSDCIHLRYILNLGCSIVENLAQQPSFRGLSFAQIRDVAAAFRAEHMDRPNPIPKLIESHHYLQRSVSQPTTIPLSKHRAVYNSPLIIAAEQKRSIARSGRSDLTTTKKPSSVSAPSMPIKPIKLQYKFGLKDTESCFAGIIDKPAAEDFDLQDAEAYFDAALMKEEDKAFDLPDAESYFDALKEVKVTLSAAHFLGL